MDTHAKKIEDSYAKKLEDFEKYKIFIEIYDKHQGVPMGLFGRGIIHVLNNLGKGKWDIQLVSEDGTYHFKFEEDDIIILRVND